MREDLLRGVYSAERAAALSGVPIRTVYYWASHDIWAPTLSDRRPKLWTYADLIAMRTIYWLRQDKPDVETSRSTMREVRRTIRAVAGHGVTLTDVRVLVDRRGKVIFETVAGEAWEALDGDETQMVAANVLNVLAPFPTEPGHIGPDLVKPRPNLRIIPGKLAGEPHVRWTRIPTQIVAALSKDGFATAEIIRLYPDLTPEVVAECIDLEEQLLKNAA
jgi:uncharacterized protein (DUF433 family)/DNA-binding transcriptional MerR regulator